jgi:hypothetical protein
MTTSTAETLAAIFGGSVDKEDIAPAVARAWSRPVRLGSAEVAGWVRPPSKFELSTTEALAKLFGTKLSGAVERRGPAPAKAPLRLSKRDQRRAWGDVGQSNRRREMGQGSKLFRTARKGPGAWRLLWQRMTPGRWYGHKIIRMLLPEYDYVGGAITQGFRRGVLERGLNPDRTGGWQDGPRYLYRRVEGVDVTARKTHWPPRLDPAEKRRRKLESHARWQSSPAGKAYRAERRLLRKSRGGTRSRT